MVLVGFVMFVDADNVLLLCFLLRGGGMVGSCGEKSMRRASGTLCDILRTG